MNEVVKGQIRHLLTFAGGAIAGQPVVAGVAPDSMEQIIGGLVIALIGQVWSWWAKRQARTPAEQLDATVARHMKADK